jgi:CheY-like chemotaxis protein
MKNKVLVVDDDHSFRELMISHLLKRGYHVDGAENGYQAMSLLRSHGPYAILVTDMMMPGINGLELLRSARKLDSEIEVITITASGSLEGAVAALREDGAFDFLTKPMEMMAELSIAVERALKYRDLRRDRERLQKLCLRESGRMHAVIASIDEPVLAAGKGGDLQYANRAAKKYLIHSQTGAQMMDVLPEAIRSAVTIWKALLQSDPARVTLYVPGCGISQVQLIAFHNSAGQTDGWIMIIRDRDPASFNEEYIRSVQSELEKAMGFHAESVRNLAVCSRLPGVRTQHARRVFADAAVAVKQVGQSMHRIQSALSFPRCSILTNESILAAGSIVDIKSLYEEGRLSGLLGVQWNIPDDLPSIKADLGVIHQAIHMFQEKRACGGGSGSISITCKEAGEWVWVDVLDLNQHPENFDQDSVKDSSCDMMVQLIVGRLGGQFWQLASGGSHIAFAFPVARRSIDWLQD